MISFWSGRRGKGMPRELSALISQANRPAYFINGVYLRCVVVAGFCVRGVSGAGLHTLRYVTMRFFIQCTTIVGAGLLAKAVCQPD